MIMTQIPCCSLHAVTLALLAAGCAAPLRPAPVVEHSGLERVWIEALGME